MSDQQYDWEFDYDNYEYAQELCAHNWTLETDWEAIAIAARRYDHEEY